MKSRTIWLTGLSGAGKSTLAESLLVALIDLDHPACILDGDVVRSGLCSDLGFSPSDRKENVRRVAEVAALLNQARITAIVALISPYAEDRSIARRIVGDGFVEVYVDTPIEICEARDPKGLYKRARAGSMQSFTGVSAPYEAPKAPDLVLHLGLSGSASAGTARIIRKLFS